MTSALSRDGRSEKLNGPSQTIRHCWRSSVDAGDMTYYQKKALLDASPVKLQASYDWNTPS